MEQLSFYTVDFEYIKFLKHAEMKERGFSCVPDMDYGEFQKPKFVCGVALQMNGIDYYVPVSSQRNPKHNTFLLRAKDGHPIGSLRFQYMFPIPKEVLKKYWFRDEPDLKYRSLVSQEWQSCIANREQIREQAESTYRRVLLGKDLGLVYHSCDFQLLEQKCIEYTQRIRENMLQQTNNLFEPMMF